MHIRMFFFGMIIAAILTVNASPIEDLNQKLVGDFSTRATEIHNAPFGDAIPLNLADFAGQNLRIRGEIKGNDISKPNVNCGGVKFMVHYVCDDGNQLWPAACDGKFGTFDWTSVTLTVMHVPQNIKSATLYLGLQDSTGEVFFRNIRADIIDLFPAPWEIPENYKCEYDERVTGDIMRRGAMSPFTRNIKEQDMRDLAAWGANLLRWQFQPQDSENQNDLTKYAKFLDDEIALLDHYLPLCDELGIKVLIDMHIVPGGRYGQNIVLGTAGEDATANQATLAPAFRMFFEKEYLDAFIESWQKLATHFKGNPAVWGYNLCNEPVQSLLVTNDYLKCQYLAAQAIREIDPDTPIVIESNNWSNLRDFSYMYPLPFKNVIYQAHIYNPGSYTHQGVFAGMPVDLPYPGNHYGEWYDMEHIKKDMLPARDFEQKYGAKMFVGEFGVIRWAPNGAQYLDDVATLLDDYKWPWCYHAFREWDGWSVEHIGDRGHTQAATEDTDRKIALLKHFAKNEKR